MALYRIGATFDSSVLVLGNDNAKTEKQLSPGALAWKYHAKARHWELCHVDAKTGDLFTTGDLERRSRRVA